MNKLFEPYINRFRELNADSEENAVTKEQLFSNKQTFSDSNVMHKMLSSGMVKRVDMNKYWLDEKVVANPKGILLQRYGVIILGIIIGIAWVALEGYFTTNVNDYPVIDIPDKNNMNLVTANIGNAEFLYDTNTWTIDTSTKPYTFYYNDSIDNGMVANFNAQLGGEFNYKLNDKLLKEIEKGHLSKNPFIDVTFSELRALNGELVAYVENTLTYTNEAIDQGIESGVVTEEMINASGGRDVFLNLPPMSQLTIFPVVDGHLWVFSGAYFNEEQKEEMIDAIAIAIESLDKI